MSELKWLLEDDQAGSDAVGVTDFVRNIVKNKAEEEYVVEEKDKDAVAKLNGLIDFTTLGRLSALSDKADRGMAYHLAKIVANDAHHYMPGEYESLSEMLADALDDVEEGSSKYYDLTFVSDKLVPFMFKHNIPGMAVLWAKGYQKKVRTCVPLLRKLFKDNSPDLVDEVKEVMSWILNADISRRDIEEKIRSKQSSTPPVPIRTIDRITGNNTGILMIHYNTTEERAAVVKKLGSLIDIHHDASPPNKPVGAQL